VCIDPSGAKKSVNPIVSERSNWCKKSKFKNYDRSEQITKGDALGGHEGGLLARLLDGSKKSIARSGALHQHLLLGHVNVHLLHA
jgi:hypothetical protein